MGPVHFKLSMSDGLTRRISFPTRPSWTDLATRIHALCSIPFSRLAVSYLDSDGDEVTLSSEEELRDFYDSGLDSTIQGNQLIRFHVVELGSHRDMDNFMDATSPQPSSTRNTFGRPAPFVFVDHDHLPFNDLFIPSPLDREMNSDSPHAFVEVIDDDIEKESEPYTDMEDSPFRGKGKARDLRASVSVDVSSSESVIADETPTKPPIHVQVHGLRPMDSGTFGLPHAASTPARETVTPTPTLPIPSSESYIQEVQQDLPGSFPAPFPDPPTPELDAQNDPNISFSHDLASLLDSLNSMFIEHPEVGENLRALLRNAGNGSYWNAQRDSIARVAEDVQRVARDAQSAVACGAQELARGVRQRAQQEAARRVTEAVGNIIRVFGVAAADLPSSNSPDDSAQAPRRPRAPTPPSPPAGVFPFMDEGGTSFYPRAPPAMAIPFQPGGVPPPVGMMPPAPPPPPVGAPVWNQFRPFPGLSSAPPSAVPHSISTQQPPEVSYYAASPNRGGTSELKAALESAKANYKIQKERYRKEQEIRRLERRFGRHGVDNSPISPSAQHADGHTSDSVGPSDAEASRRPDPILTAAPPRQIISNARGRFPQLEMDNFPRSPTKQRGGDKVQHVNTVIERLEVMGFHEETYPTMRTVVESHLPGDGSTVMREVEDEVMSEILEKLMETSGSGIRSAT